MEKHCGKRYEIGVGERDNRQDVVHEKAKRVKRGNTNERLSC